MFKIQSEVLQGVVSGLAKGAGKARLDNKPLFITAEEGKATFFFNGEDISVEKKVEVDLENQLSISTTMSEMRVKVGLLPKDEEISVGLEGNSLQLKWGRSSKITVDLLADTSPLLEIPQLVDSVTWKPRALHGINRALVPFCALEGNKLAEQNPIILGVNFSMDDTEEVFVRATNGAAASTIRSDVQWFSGIEASIPAPSIAALAEVLPEEAEVKVSMSSDSSLLVFKCGSTTALTRTLRGKYPPVDGAFTPLGEHKGSWTFDRQEILGLVRRISRLDAKEPILRVVSDGNKVFGVDKANVLKQQIGGLPDGEKFDFNVNANYVEMAAVLFRTEEISFTFSTEKGPATLCSEEDESINVLVAQLNI